METDCPMTAANCDFGVTRSQIWADKFHALGHRTAGVPSPIRDLCRGVWLCLLVALDPTLSSYQRLKALLRFWGWQLWRRVVHKPLILEYADGRLLCFPPWSNLAGITIATGSHEPREQQFVSRLLRSGDLAVDVGANIGIYTILAGHHGASVIAFEPGTRSRVDLNRNLQLNDLHQVTVVPSAVSDRSASLWLTTDAESSNRLIGSQTRNSERVSVVRLDDCLNDIAVDEDHLGLLKIDTEGYDLRVLEGGACFISRVKPVILVETWGDNNVRTWLEGAGYRVFFYDLPDGRLAEFPTPWDRQANFLAIHHAKLPEVTRRMAGEQASKRSGLPSIHLGPPLR